MNPGGGGGYGGGGHGVGGHDSGSVVPGGGGDGGGSGVEDLDDLWPSQPSNAAAMLAKISVDNPATSDRFTLGLGGVEYVSDLPILYIFALGASEDSRVRVF